MGLMIKTNACCGCKNNKEHDIMRIVAQKIGGMKIEYILECPICKIQVSISVRMIYDDTHKGLHVFYTTDDSMNDERMLVLVCHKCNKLIGTRENYFIHRKKINRKFVTVLYCEGCHDKM
jgi:hypothetical protein